jgi:hypothetical protein
MEFHALHHYTQYPYELAGDAATKERMDDFEESKEV